MKAKAFVKFYCCLIILAGSYFSVSAQDAGAKFGKIEEQELALKSFEADTSAEAVVLSDHAYSHFNFTTGKTQLIFERHTRVKILKKSGYDWANVSIPLYQNNSSKEKVNSIKGFTYNLVDGKLTKDKLETKAVFEEQINEHWSSKKFTMPNVKEGSVVEYSYIIVSDFIYNLRDWEFQTSVPTVWSEYEVQMPQYFDYKFLYNGYHPFHKTGKGGGDSFDLDTNRGVYSWKMKDVPALKEERYITTLDDYRAKIEFELQVVHHPVEGSKTMTGEWNQVIDELLSSERFGTQLNRKGYFKNEVAAILAKYNTPEQQMEAIHELVKKKVKWDGMHSIYTGGPLRKVYDNGKGNAAEINLMLTAMLQEAGLEAAPVLVSTRRHGKIYKATPLLTKFNYIVAHVKIDNKDYLLDATDPLLPAGMLSYQCLNGEGRLVKSKSDVWLPLKPKASYTEFRIGEFAISETGEVKGKTTDSYQGYSALDLRRSILEAGEQKYAEEHNKSAGDYKRSGTVFKDLHSVEKPLELSYEVQVEGNKQQNNLIYLNPMMGQNLKENPFKLKYRYYPVDFAVPIDETLSYRFTLPAGYTLDEKPAPVSIALPNKGGQFLYRVEQQGNVVTLMSKISINKTVFGIEEYPYLKELYDQIVAKQAESIVIKKGEGKTL
ncbi:DUF3857 domain-containing protein [Pontibacter sp. SGAir0037]|uniref:DUF3857 domain-containing protein n=1 Tax=Pontibacter sp. SGAir0037 TaxID=2571030 RepID=UPI0010CCF2E7|nr:DUF3857 domain-containing protein [Pontibacter sp. SGAir0037]QCR24441.1 hypothetical protein C1N53_20150 [Pontibacter sp. SGAir0037]